MSKRYTEDFKHAILEQYRIGVSAAELCAQHGIARSALFSWLKQYSVNESGQIPREQYFMQTELQRLRTENQIFRESGCCPSSPLDMRLEAIYPSQGFLQYSCALSCPGCQPFNILSP